MEMVFGAKDTSPISLNKLAYTESKTLLSFGYIFIHKKTCAVQRSNIWSETITTKQCKVQT